MFSKDFLINKLEQITEFSFAGALFLLPFSKALLELFLSVSLISWFLLKIISGSSFSQNRSLLIIMGLFIISSSLSAFTSGFPLLATRGIIKLIRYSLVLLVSFDLLQDSKKLKRLCFIEFLCFLAVLVDALAQRIIGKDLISGIPVQYADQQVRLTAPFHAYGLLGAFLMALLPILIVIIFIKSKKHGFKTMFLLVIPAVAFYVLYKTHSRGAWLAALGSWLLFAVIMRQKMLIAGIIGIFLVAPFVLPRNALIHLDIERKEQSLVERYYLWDRAIQVIKARPWFGCGINTYGRNYSKFDKTKSWRVPGYYVHNGYLQIAAETGLVSLALFLLLIFTGLKSAYLAFRKSSGDQKLLVASLITGFSALLLQAIVDTTLHNTQSAVLIWCFLGLLLSMQGRLVKYE